MKKFFLSLVLVALSAMTFAQQWTGISKNAPAGPVVKLVSSSEQQVVVDFSLSGFYLTRVSTPNGIEQIVSVPKMASMLEAGAPDLPQFPVPVIIGDLAEMQVSVIRSAFTDYENVEIAPSKGNFSRMIDPESVAYTYGEMYSQDAFYPTVQAYLETPYIIRDFRGQNIMVRPFAYNPVTKTLRVYNEMTIEMRKVSDNGINQKAARKGSVKMSDEMKAAYGHRFINFKESAAKYTFVQDRGEMLVICPSQYMDAMQPFVDWKNQSGRPTTMVSVTNAGGNNDSQIKNYINSIYTNPERNLEFVLLVGDYSDITPHSMSGGRSDNWFGQLEGNDNYLEVLTGRFSVQSVADVETHVSKVLYYERDMKDEVTWVNKGIGIGANEGGGQGHNGGEADYVHINYIRDTLMHYTYESVSQQYSGVGSGTSANAISTDVNNGASIINYCNHGSQTSWAVANYSNSHVNALVNDDKWPYIWSVACNNGQFDGTCFGEAWLRATNNTTGRPTGAVGGMFSWISQPWVPPMTGQDEMVDILTEWKYNDQYCHTFGGASLNGNMYILDMHPSDAGATHNTWILFGDPTLMVRTDNPVNMNVSCSPAVLMLGMSELEVSAENTAYGIVTMMMDGEVVASGYIQDGICNLSFPPMSNVGTATLTVIGYNKVTAVMEVDVLPAEGAYLTINGYTPNTAIYNTETDLSISFKNVGVEATNGTTTVTLSCTDERLHIVNNVAQLGTLAANATATLENAFRFYAEDGVENGTRFQLNITMENGRQTWEGKAFITIEAPVLSVDNISTNELQPGEPGYINFYVTNNGDADAENAIFEVSSSSPDIMLECDYRILGQIEAGQTLEVPINLTVAEGVAIGSTYEINYLLTATHYSVQGSYIFTVGNIIEGFETGDFSMYEWTFTGNSNWTVVNTEAHSGNYSAKSGQINDSQQTNLVLTIDILADGEVSFYKKVSSENNYDKLFFSIDGTEKDNWSGEVAWSQSSYPITAGTHTFKWSYQKDYMLSDGSDCAWVDDIQFPPTSVVLSLDPVTNLQAEVDGPDVILTWDAVEAATQYVLRRNGEEIAILTETNYEDHVEIPDTYTYSVVAKDDEGHCSAAAFVTVDTELVGVEENNNKFSVYPNPVNNTLYINGGNTEYSYVMFNGMGQVVANGNSQGTAEINVSNMTEGIYFLRITTGAQVLVEKVVVK